jgi:hypothetical protein
MELSEITDNSFFLFSDRGRRRPFPAYITVCTWRNIEIVKGPERVGGVFAMKSFQEFCSEIAGQVEKQLGEGHETVLRSVQKNNGVMMEGLLIRYQEAAVVPTIYMDPFYEQYCEGRTMEHIVADVVEIYKNNRVPFQKELPLSYEDIKDRILFRLVNLPLNREALLHMPHIEIGDLAVGFHWTVDTDDSRVGTVRVTDEQAAVWGVSTEQLTEIALRNTERSLPPVLRRIEDVLTEILNGGDASGLEDADEAERELLREELNDEGARREFPMYVLSNSFSNGGAAALLELPFLNRFREKIGEDFWILPSSIHEVILVPVSKLPDRDKLTQMVREINRTQVPRQEFLSDVVYRFSEFTSLMPQHFREQLMAVAG